MAKPATYREQVKIENTMRLREFLSELPPYVKEYFRAKETTTSDKTRLSYAYDLRVFFRFLREKKSADILYLQGLLIQNPTLIYPAANYLLFLYNLIASRAF